MSDRAAGSGRCHIVRVLLRPAFASASVRLVLQVLTWVAILTAPGLAWTANTRQTEFWDFLQAALEMPGTGSVEFENGEAVDEYTGNLLVTQGPLLRPLQLGDAAMPLSVMCRILVSGMAVSACLAMGGVDDADPVEQWVDDNYEQAFNRWIPSEKESGKDEMDTLWRATVLVSPSHDGPQYRLEIKKKQPGLVIGQLVALEESDLWNQMESIKRRSPNASLDTVLGRLRQREVTVASDRCPGLKILGDRYEELSYPLALEPRVVADAPNYRIWIENPGLSSVRVTYNGSVSDGAPGLLKWIDDAYKLLLPGCKGR